MITAEQIYADYFQKVQAYVRGKVQAPHEVEDLVSAIFLKVVQKLDSYDPAKASVSTWVYAITRNTVTDYFRTRRTLVSLEDYMVDEKPEQELNDDALEILADALLTLNEKQRDLIVLHYYKGYTLKVVAEMMGMSYINAKVIHKKALDDLRHFMRPTKKIKRGRTMTENMRKFLEAVSQNEEMTAKVGAMGKEELIALAKELGIELTEADLEKPAVQELDDDDLDTVAGGSDVSCACAMGGGGTKDSNDKTCACVLAGAGYSKNGWERCLCGFAGYGYDT